MMLFLLFSLTTKTFLTEFNLVNMMRNVSVIGIVAVGMTLLFIAGEVDLSVGSVLGFLTIIFGELAAGLGLNPWLTAALVIIFGVGTGLLNGFIRTLLNIPSFIVTLAGWTAYRSLCLIVSGDRPMSLTPVGTFYQVTGGALFHIPCLILWMLATVLVGGIVLSQTRFGYHIFATGGNLEAAQDAGIHTNRVKLAAFAITGGVCGLAAALLVGYLHVAEPTTGAGLVFLVIGAVVVGGAELTGGRGSMIGTFIGTLIIAVLTGGMVLLGFSQGMADVATGALIVAVGTIDLLLRRAGDRR